MNQTLKALLGIETTYFRLWSSDVITSYSSYGRGFGLGGTGPGNYPRYYDDNFQFICVGD